MSGKTNKGKGSGLRILWIPSRKKHNRKGQYETTNKKIDYSSRQKRNQQWSLGGSRTHEKLVQGNLSEISDVSPACSSVTASCIAGAGILHAVEQSGSKTDDTNLDKKNIIPNNCTKVEESVQESENKDRKKKKADEKIVNYLYYSLMCCECSIS